MTDANMPATEADDPLDADSRPDVPRVHSEDPAEGVDPDEEAAGVEADVPRVHTQDTTEG